MEVLQKGYKIPFECLPPLSDTPVSFETYDVGSPRGKALDEEVSQMLAKGALELASDDPGFTTVYL